MIATIPGVVELANVKAAIVYPMYALDEAFVPEFACLRAMSASSNMWRFGPVEDLRFYARACQIGDGQVVINLLDAFEPTAVTDSHLALVKAYAELYCTAAPHIARINSLTTRRDREVLYELKRLGPYAPGTHESVARDWRRGVDTDRMHVAMRYVADAEVLLVGWVEQWNRTILKKLAGPTPTEPVH